MRTTSSMSSDDDASKREVTTVLATLLVSFPAVIGSGCWPLLVAGALGTVATEESKRFAHSISFGINLAVTTNIFQAVWRKSKSTTTSLGERKRKKKAATLTCISIPLIMLDNVRHVLQDGQMIGNWSSMYRKRCYHRDLRCLSLVGWTCQIATTVGFGLLFAGVLMSSGAWVKVKRRFRELRGV